jgi:transcriptional regulator with XRE-family HTH domain
MHKGNKQKNEEIIMVSIEKYNSIVHQRRQGQNFQGLLNDLKRRPEDAAMELGTEVDQINAIIKGDTELPAELIKRAADIWPVNERDFHIIKDDCPTGVKIMTAEESEKSSRVMLRAREPYYDYRDTAMSSVGQFRPEWILELCDVEDNDPENPKVQWNNGHFMHQFTYFIGPVNFYFKGEDGEKKVAVMNTGDSMYITPFVPHTFTTRKNDDGKKGLILALTYGNKLAGETQQELSALGLDIGSQYALDFSSRGKAFGDLVKFHRQAATLGLDEMVNRTKLNKDYLSSLESGELIPDMPVLKTLADALSVNVYNLLPADKKEERVIVRPHEDNRSWSYPEEQPAYQITELAQTKNLPGSKSFEFLLKGNDNTNLDIKCGLHQYVYNIGDTEVDLNWKSAGENHSEAISPGDSLYMKPFVEHNFRGEGKLLVLRIGGRTYGEPQRELSDVGKDNTQRAICESMPWFNPEGKSNI